MMTATYPLRNALAKKLVRRFALGGLVVLACVAAILAYQAILRQTGNFHEVVAGQLYRSAQPTPERLRDYITDHGIQIVINLRGKQEGATWYDSEVAVAREQDVHHIDFGMSATRPFSPQRAEELVNVMASAKRPILIHCRTGADRTGLASIIYASRLGEVRVEVAESQLSIRYGRVGIPVLSPTYATQTSWEAIERAWGMEGS